MFFKRCSSFLRIYDSFFRKFLNAYFFSNLAFIDVTSTKNVENFQRNDLFIDFCPGKAQDIDCSPTNEFGKINTKTFKCYQMISNAYNT